VAYDSNAAIIPVRPGVNFAPLDPLLKLKEQQGRSHYICDALKERFAHFWNLEKMTWREMINAGELVGRFLQGDQLIERNPWTGGWLVIKPPREDDSAKRALNLMQFYVTNCIVKYIQSNPDVVVKPGRDTDQSEAASKAGGIIVDHYENEFFKPWPHLQEGLQILTFGTAINRLRYDPGIQGVVGLREIVENREITLGEGAAYCGDCGRDGTAVEFTSMLETEAGPQEIPLCPNCGSDAVLIEPPATETMPTVVGQEPVQLGDFCLDQLLFPACRWDLNSRAEKSPWFLYQQRISLGAVRRLLGRVRIPDSASDYDLGLDVAQNLAYVGQATDGRASGQRGRFLNQDKVNLCEMWLSPDDYADIDLKGDEQTVASAQGQGPALPAGGKLVDLFPDGLVAVGLNGMSVVLGVYAEKHCDHITSSVWHMRPMSGAGRGAQDMVEVQKRLNKLDSQQLAYMDALATPAVFHDKNIVDSDDMGYIGHPRANIPVDLSKLPELKRLQDAVYAMQPGSVPAGFTQYVQQFLTQAFATTSHATDFTNGGLMAQRNDTARGAMIADSNANSLILPMAMVKGDGRMSVAEKTVKHYPKHFPIKRYFPLGGEHSQQPGIWLSAADLNADLRYEVSKESELPENSVTKRDNANAFFIGLFGGIANYLIAQREAPELVAGLARLYKVQTFGGVHFDVTAQICRKRLEQMKQGLVMGMDPVMSIQPPISLMERDHKGKAIWFQSWLDTDEGQNAPIEQRASVEFLIQSHFELQGMQDGAFAAQAAQTQLAGAPPMAPPEEQAMKEAA
jgi:hypothetical protein